MFADGLYAAMVCETHHQFSLYEQCLYVRLFANLTKRFIIINIAIGSCTSVFGYSRTVCVCVCPSSAHRTQSFTPICLSFVSNEDWSEKKKCNTSTNQKQKCIIIISDFYQNRFLWRPRQISRCNNFSICVWGGYNTHNKFMLVEDYGQKNARQNLHTAQINPRY